MPRRAPLNQSPLVKLERIRMRCRSAGTVTGDVVTGPMSPPPAGQRLDQRWPLTASGARDGLTDDRSHQLHVVAVHRLSRNAVTSGARSDRRREIVGGEL